MVNGQTKRMFRKRTIRRFNNYKLKLSVIFLVVFATTALFISFFVGTSSVLESIEGFNRDYNVEDGTFLSEEEAVEYEGVETEEIKYGEFREADYTIRIFQQRETINRHQVTSGNDIQNNDEMLVDKNFLEANDWSFKDVIEINGREVDVVGTAISPDYITTKNSNLVLQANAEVFGIGFVNEETFQELFGDNYTSYYAYTSDFDIQQVSEIVDPIQISDSENNTRIQQVIGDAEAPRDLALLLTCLLYLIVVVLLSVYHFEVSKKENNNLATFHKLGFSNRTLFKHYVMETTITLCIAWVIGSIIGVLAIDTIKNMNNQIYNYPVLGTNNTLLALCLIISLAFVFVINLILVYQFYLKVKKPNSKVKISRKKKRNRIRLFPFPYQYRIKRIVRNKKEMLLFIILIFFVGMLINFSFLLKDSVTKYVDDLAIENTFEEIVFTNHLWEEEMDGEEFYLYNLYDEDGVTQSVYVIDSDSEYYHYNLQLNDKDVIITQAFANKYDKEIGDEIVLTDITNEKEYKLKVSQINSVTTVSNIYVVSNNGDIFEEETFATAGVTLAESLDDSNNDGIEATLTKNEIITSGENILEVINKQITLILVLAIVLQVALLYSLLEFTYQNSMNSMRSLKLQGYSLSELMKMHFAFSIPIAILCIVSSYLVSRIAVRLFLDQIMFDFVNFVQVTDSLFIILLSNGMVLAIFVFLLYRLRAKMKTI